MRNAGGPGEPAASEERRLRTAAAARSVFVSGSQAVEEVDGGAGVAGGLDGALAVPVIVVPLFLCTSPCVFRDFRCAFGCADEWTRFFAPAGADDDDDDLAGF